MSDRLEEPQKEVELRRELLSRILIRFNSRLFDCTVGPGSVDSLTMSENEPPEPPGYETVRLCLYGETEEAHLKFVPTELHLGEITVGQAVHRELTISNPSKSASLTYKFLPNVTARCKPSDGRIAPQNSIQVLITVTGSYNGT